MKPAAAASIVATVLCAAPAQAQPVAFDLPARPVWCVASQPVVVDETQGQGSTSFAVVLFNALYARLEKAALEQRVPSIGIPFAESLQAQPPQPAAAPAASGPAPMPAPTRYVLRVCANVPPELPPPAETARVQALVLPATRVYAALCDAADDSACRQALQTRLQADLKLTPAQLEAVQWQVAQPLDADGRADGLRASLTDFKTRPLDKDMPVPSLPRDKLILWAPAPSGR